MHLLLEFARKQGEVERLRDALHHRAPLFGERDRRFEELLDLERGSYLDADERVLVAGVREVVRDAGRDDDHGAGAGDDPLPSQREAHRALDDLEALLLQRVAVQAARHAGVLREFEVDSHELAVGLRGGLAEGDPLAARGVLECLSWVCHHCLRNNTSVLETI